MSISLKGQILIALSRESNPITLSSANQGHAKSYRVLRGGVEPPSDRVRAGYNKPLYYRSKASGAFPLDDREASEW